MTGHQGEMTDGGQFEDKRLIGQAARVASSRQSRRSVNQAVAAVGLHLI